MTDKTSATLPESIARIRSARREVLALARVSTAQRGELDQLLVGKAGGLSLALEILQATTVKPGACGDPDCHVLHRDPAHPIHPPEPGERPHRHVFVRHTHPDWHGHCDPDEPGYKPCDQPHWHFWWRHRHA